MKRFFLASFAVSVPLHAHDFSVKLTPTRTEARFGYSPHKLGLLIGAGFDGRGYGTLVITYFEPLANYLHLVSAGKVLYYPENRDLACEVELGLRAVNVSKDTWVQFGADLQNNPHIIPTIAVGMNL